MKQLLIKINSELKLCLFLLLATQIFTFVNAQSVPTPFFQFPLDGPNPTRWEDHDGFRHTGKSGGTLTPVSDRFGIANNAIQFSDNAFLYEGIKPTVLSKENNVTVSFWTKLNSAHSYPSDFNPYIPGITEKGRYFSLTADSKSGGLARLKNNAILGAERTVEVSGTKKPWFLWMNIPAMLEQAGWYHIVMVATKEYTKVYIYKPDGSKACSYNYMGNYYDKIFSIGKIASYPLSQEHVSSASILDDFKLWDSALTEQQVQTLHIEERPELDGTFYNIVNLVHQKVVDNGNKLDNSTPIIQYDKTGVPWQDWIFKYVATDAAGKYYKIINRKSGKVLDNGNNLGNGTPIFQNERNNNSWQDWRVEYAGADVGGKYYKIINRKTSKALDNQNLSNNSTPIVQYDYVGAMWQNWRLNKIPFSANLLRGNYRIKSHENTSTPNLKTLTNSGNLQVIGLDWDFLANKNQSWEIYPNGDGSYYIQQVIQGKRYYVYADKSSVDDIYYPYISSSKITDDQAKWFFVSSDHGTYQIVNKKHVLYLVNMNDTGVMKLVENPADNSLFDFINLKNAPGSLPLKNIRISNTNSQEALDNEGQMASGTTIVQHHYTSQTNQVWKLEEVGSDHNGKFYLIVNQTSNKVLDNGHSLNNSTEVVQYEKSNVNWQNWYFLWTGGTFNNKPSYYIVNQYSGKVLDNEHRFADDTPIVQYDKVGDSWQKWFFVDPPNQLAANTTNISKNSNLKISKNTSLEISKNSKFNIFPNPSNGTLNISLTLQQEETVDFDFYDMLGKKVYSETRIMSTSKKIITLENLKYYLGVNQLYILKAKSANGKELFVSKVIFK